MGYWYETETPAREDTGHTHRRQEGRYGQPATEGVERVLSHAEDAESQVRKPELDEGIAASESLADRKSLYP